MSAQIIIGENGFVHAGELKQHFIKVIQKLSILNKTDDVEKYHVKRYTSDDYFGLNLNRIRINASNKYEIWLKLYLHCENHCKSNEHGCTHDIYCEDSIEESFDYICSKYKIKFDDENHVIISDDIMIKLIDDYLESYKNSKWFWWELEQYIDI